MMSFVGGIGADHVYKHDPRYRTYKDPYDFLDQQR